jgi:acetaldehyde dehydrogenase/alcohol dehydrogenase
LKEYGIAEDEFYSKLDEMAECAFDDQTTGANPVYPMIAQIKQMFVDAYHGN